MMAAGSPGVKLMIAKIRKVTPNRTGIISRTRRRTNFLITILFIGRVCHTVLGTVRIEQAGVGCCPTPAWIRFLCFGDQVFESAVARPVVSEVAQLGVEDDTLSHDRVGDGVHMDIVVEGIGDRVFQKYAGPPVSFFIQTIKSLICIETPA